MNILNRIIRLLINLHHIIRVKIDPVKYARSIGVKVGENCRLISVVPVNGTFSSEPYLIKLGDHVTVGGLVRFITHDGGVWVFREKESDIDIVGPIIVGNNVFIGTGCIILPSVKIGDNCVIGAGSIVTKNIPRDSIAAGVPARVIKSTDEYYASCSKKKINIGNVPDTEKRKILEDMFLKDLS